MEFNVDDYKKTNKLKRDIIILTLGLLILSAIIIFIMISINNKTQKEDNNNNNKLNIYSTQTTTTGKRITKEELKNDELCTKVVKCDPKSNGKMTCYYCLNKADKECNQPVICNAS